MIKYVAIALPGLESLLVVQRVHLYVLPQDAPLSEKQFETLVTPEVMEKYPTGRILGWFDSTQTLVNSSDIKVGFDEPRKQPRNRRKRPHFSDIERLLRYQTGEGAVDKQGKKREKSQTEGWLDVIKNLDVR